MSLFPLSYGVLQQHKQRIFYCNYQMQCNIYLVSTLMCIAYLHFGRTKFKIVDSATSRVDPACCETAFYGLKWHIQVNHSVYLTLFIKSFCLSNRSGETFLKETTL